MSGSSLCCFLEGGVGWPSARSSSSSPCPPGWSTGRPPSSPLIDIVNILLILIRFKHFFKLAWLKLKVPNDDLSKPPWDPKHHFRVIWWIYQRPTINGTGVKKAIFRHPFRLGRFRSSFSHFFCSPELTVADPSIPIAVHCRDHLINLIQCHLRCTRTSSCQGMLSFVKTSNIIFSKFAMQFVILQESFLDASLDFKLSISE